MLELELDKIKSERDVQKFIKKNHLEISNYLNAGMIFNLKNKFLLAEKYLKCGIFISEKLIEIYEMLLRYNVYNASTKIKTIDEYLLHFYYELGLVYIYQGKNKNALKVINKLKKFYSKSGEAYFLLGKYYENKNKIKRAINEYYKALELCEDKEDLCFNVYQNIIPLLIKDKNYHKAKEFYNLAIKKFSESKYCFSIFEKILKKHKC